jgi:hypothetical protein
MTDIRHEIELVTPGLNFLEDQGAGAKSVIERTKKTLHQAHQRIEELEYALRSIADTPIGKEVPDRTTTWGLAFHMQQTATDALKEGRDEQR